MVFVSIIGIVFFLIQISSIEKKLERFDVRTRAEIYFLAKQ